MKLKVKIEDQFFDVEVEDVNARPVLAKVDGETFEVYPDEGGAVAPAAVSAASLASVSAAFVPAAAPAPAAESAAAGSKAVTAPIPGTIVGISVKVGDSVSAGQELLSLEAMKMKNAIRATRSGKVGVIHVAVGDKVRHGQVMLEFSD